MTGRRIAILGTGLIGASIGMGLRGTGDRVVGWDPDRAMLDVARRRGALDEIADGPDSAAESAEIVVIAAPAGAVVDLVATLATPALVTDVAGIKAEVVAAAAGLDRFVGGHPMAGREHRGADAASAALFRGAAWVVTTDGATADDIAGVSALAGDLGARPVTMTAAEHDRAVAVISHLPQVLAGALLEAAAEVPGALALAAGSFRDLTRVAASDPAMWVDVLSGNAPALAAAVDDLSGRLSGWSAAAVAGDRQRLSGSLAAAAARRNELAPPVVAVGVALEDRPGELARVGRALAASGVDVRDLQLRHGLHGGGGVLTLSVRPGEDETLGEALAAEGLTVLGGVS